MTSARMHISERYVIALEKYALGKSIALRSLLDAREAGDCEQYERAGEYPFELFASLLERCATTAGDDAFALGFAQALPVRPAGVFQTIMSNSRTLRDGFCGLCRLCTVKASALSLAYTEDKEAGWIEFFFAPQFLSSTQFMSGEAAVIALRVKDLLGDDMRPLRMAFPFAEPRNLEAFAAVFGPNIEFGAAETKIAYPLAALHRPLAIAPLKLVGGAAGGRGSVALNVAAIIRGALQRGEATEAHACRALNIGRRTLQRELMLAGTCFRKILESERRRSAEYYLSATDLSLTAISALLGYSEQSAFSRACRGWFGQSPSAFRRDANRAEEAARMRAGAVAG